MTTWLCWSAFILALLCADAAVLAGFGSRMGWWHFSTGFDILTWAAYGGLTSAALGFAGWLTALWHGRKGHAMLAFAGLIVGLVVVGVPWQMKRTARQVPPIHDISTDVQDPPHFVAVLAARKDAPNSADYGGPDVAALQQAAYPDIRPVTLPIPASEALRLVQQAAEAMGWEIVSVDPMEGVVEATDTTFWFGFKDDIVVRVRPVGKDSRIDVRSVSRVGRSDVGANAQRIRAYMATLRSAAPAT